MVAYSFQAQFIVPICAKTKQFTLRGIEAMVPALGESIDLYYAINSPFKRLLGTSTYLGCLSLRLNFKDNEIFGGYDFTDFLPDLNTFAIGAGHSSWFALAEFYSDRAETNKYLSRYLIYWGDTFTPPAKS
jgi:hypothetical protein